VRQRTSVMWRWHLVHRLHRRGASLHLACVTGETNTHNNRRTNDSMRPKRIRKTQTSRHTTTHNESAAKRTLGTLRNLLAGLLARQDRLASLIKLQLGDDDVRCVDANVDLRTVCLQRAVNGHTQIKHDVASTRSKYNDAIIKAHVCGNVSAPYPWSICQCV